MVRTKGDGGAARTVDSKAPRKALGGGSGAAVSAIAGAGAAASPGSKYEEETLIVRSLLLTGSNR